MCGIVGIAQSAGRNKYGLADVKRMADAILHRGPDDQGTHDGGKVILGMRRLSIIDLEGGHQPIHNEDRSIWVVNNGEIYNYQHLREKLIAKGHTFLTNSDTEVLVHLYEEHGDEFLTHVDGMFALALWDSNREKLIIARDRLGIKPVYYWCNDGVLAFTSEIKSLRSLPGFRTAVDHSALSDYLSIGYAVAPTTIFAGVKRLAPATALFWRDGNHQIRQYWSPPGEVDNDLSHEEWLVRIRDELDRAVSDQMVSDVPVGAFLSGGVDSSAISALMATKSDEPINTYSIGYRGGQVAKYYNELPFAKIVAGQIGSRHREIEVQPDIARLLPRLMWHLEEPISDSAITTTYLVSELASQSVKVILSGVGGDELFAGYTRYLGDHYSAQYQRLPRWCRQHLLPGLVRLLPSGRQNRLMDAARYAKRFVQAEKMDWRDRYQFYLAIASDNLLDSLLIGRNGSRDNGLRRIAMLEDSDDELLRLMRIDWQTQLSENLLLLTDKMTMACSIECRVPFLDHRLVETAATIPGYHKMPNGNLKGLLKDSLRGILPDTIVDRRKRGFGAPIGAWFKQELAPLRAELLDRATLENRGLLNADTVQRICTEHDRNREDYTDLILVLMNIEIWSRLFLDGRSHEDVSGELVERSLAA